MLALARASDAESAFHIGRQLLESRDAAAALACFNHARDMGFDPDQCAAQRWFCHMLLGQFERAWRESDEIAQRGTPDPHAWWDGKPITEGTLMVRCLRGLGDTIQFIRYVAMARERASRVVVSAPPSLVSLLGRMPGIDEFCEWAPEAAEPAFDQQVEVTEFPRIFRTTVETVPVNVPYFDMGTARASGAVRRVGLCWTASDWDTSRSLSFDEIARLRSVEGVELSTLQFGPEHIGTRLADPAKPVLNTAEAIRDLDLVISVDTMVAHLAGALNKPVWILLPFAADWRWMLSRDTSPWYPSGKLFRQSTPGGWNAVVDRVAAALTREVQPVLNS